jgi:predicted TIM-barrel fold metal-dependent hydrolase
MTRCRLTLHASVLALCAGPVALAQPPGDIRDLRLRDWQPAPVLKIKTTDVTRARFPAVDIHNHLGGGKESLPPEKVRRYLQEMDAAGIRTVINLDGGWGDRLRETIERLDRAHPGRFLTFAQIDFEGFGHEGWTARELAKLEDGFRAGARGLKVHKSLGLGRRDADGRLIAVDDPRIDPLWELCGRLGRPVVIHTGDPSAFFTPTDRHNERLLQLDEHPDWSFHGPPYPARGELQAQRLRVIARHPKTTFICAHMANDGEDLAELAGWLDAHPNMFVGIDARISELGRQPYTARRFLLKYQDRVLFGTDAGVDLGAFRTYIRFLETDDEYFAVSSGYERLRFWRIYGVFLPDEVLEKVYRRNAERLLGMARDASGREHPR